MTTQNSAKRPLDTVVTQRTPAATTLNDYITIDQWQSFVESHSDRMVFHDRRWMELLISQYGCQLTIPAVQKHRNIVAAIPFLQTRTITGARRLTCLPFTDYVTLLAHDPNSVTSLCRYIYEESLARCAPTVIRSDQPIKGLLHESLQVRHELWTARPMDEIVKSFSPVVRKNLRRSREAGLTFERRFDAAAIQTFYQLHLLTRRKLGVPIQPRTFFDRFYEAMIAQGLGFVGVVSQGREPVAAAVFLTYNGRLMYKYAASQPRALSLRPNDMLVYGGIQVAAENGFTTFDFGISNRQHQGLRRFKKKWGARESSVFHNYVNGMVPASTGNSHAARLAMLAIRYGPPVVCRAFGEMFYKFSA